MAALAFSRCTISSISLMRFSISLFFLNCSASASSFCFLSLSLRCSSIRSLSSLSLLSCSSTLSFSLRSASASLNFPLALAANTKLLAVSSVVSLRMDRFKSSRFSPILVSSVAMLLILLMVVVGGVNRSDVVVSSLVLIPRRRSMVFASFFPLDNSPISFFFDFVSSVSSSSSNTLAMS